MTFYKLVDYKGTLSFYTYSISFLSKKLKFGKMWKTIPKLKFSKFS